MGHAGLAQTSGSPSVAGPTQSWTSTSELQANNVNPIRVTDSHTQSGNRTVDVRSIQTRGADGRMEPYQDIERETLQVDADTVRITTRTFDRDVNRRKTLVQVTEEEKRTLPGGSSKIVRLTSNPDLSGKLQPVQREIVETKKLGANGQETDTTVMLPGINGMAPAFKTQEVRKQVAVNAVQTTKTTYLLDGSGHWQVNEIRQVTTREQGNELSSEERISRLDSAGKLGEVSRVVTKELETGSGERTQTVETYSFDVPGASQDGSLHLVERTTTAQGSRSGDEQATEKRVEKLNPGDPNSDLRVSVLIESKQVAGPAGEQSAVTIRARDSNGSFGVVSVDMTKSDRIPTIQIQPTSSAQPK